MLRRLIALPLVLVMALALAMIPSKRVGAQQGITWQTGFQVQNLSTARAWVTIQFYNAQGQIVATIPNDPIPGQSSKTYFPIPSIPAGFQGSAVITADQQVAAILNITGNNFAYSESVLGISNPTNNVRLPLIQRNNNGFSTWIAVQNAGTSDARVEIQFTPGPEAGNAYTMPPQNIPSGASLIIDQATQDQLGPRFIGSATLTSNQPLAVVVNQTGTGNFKTLLAYSGFSAGSSKVILPLVQQANAGFFTGIAVQNSGTTSAEVVINYGPNLVQGQPGLPNDRTYLQGGESATFIKNGPTRYIGSAEVTVTGGEVVVVVNQLSPKSGSSYEGFDPNAATPNVSLPLLMANNGGFDTGVQCRHLGTGPVTITLTYTPNTVGPQTPSPVSEEIEAGASFNVLQGTIGYRYVGSGIVTTNPATPVVCIVNQLDNRQDDRLLTYNGINY